MKNYNKLVSSEKIYSILKKPITTEKSTNLQQFNQYTFLVSKESNRNEIKQAIEKIFKVKVTKINTSIIILLLLPIFSIYPFFFIESINFFVFFI